MRTRAILRSRGLRAALGTLLTGVIAAGLIPAPGFAASSEADNSARIATATAARMRSQLPQDVEASRPQLSHEASGLVNANIDGIDVGLAVPNSDHGLKDVGTTIVASGAHADSVVQAAPAGVQALTVIRGAAAPQTYTYTLTDASFSITDKGAVSVVRGGKTIGVVAPAWAVDAVGNSVRTWYEVHAGALVQFVEHRGAAYPVVADPSISFGWYIYVRYNKSEVRQINARAVEAGNYAALAFMCLMLAAVNPALGAVCGVLGAAYIDAVMQNFKDAQAAGQCVEHRYTYGPGVLVGWTRYNC